MTISEIKYRLYLLSGNIKAVKYVNLILNQIEYGLKINKLTSLPRSLNLELNNYCNLKCPSCPTNVNSSKRKKGQMSLLNARTIFNKIQKKVISVAFGGNGEITLLPDIGQYLISAKKSGLVVAAESNFNCDKKIIEQIFSSGLDIINISLDGATAETYEKYRKGGNFNQVVSNIVYLSQLKRKHAVVKPVIQWQMIVNKYNESEIGKVKNLYKSLGVNTLRMNLPFIPGGDHYFFKDNKKLVIQLSNEFLPENKKKYGIRRKKSLLTCYQPYSELQVLYNGTVIPCCRLREKNIIIGNLLSSSLEEIWNNDKFVFFRKQLKSQGKNKSCIKCYQNMVDFNNKRVE